MGRAWQSAALLAFALVLFASVPHRVRAHAVGGETADAYPLYRLQEVIEAGLVNASNTAIPSALMRRAVVGGAPTNCPATGSPSYQSIETLCDGIDNDCDGVVDLIIPTGVAACTVAGAKGRCAAGWYQCTPSGRVCIAGSPAPESLNGVDDDCDGIVDNVKTPRQAASRLALLVPSYISADTEVLNAVAILDQWGVPYTRVNGDAAVDSALATLTSVGGTYSVVLIPVRVDPNWLTQARADKLTAFANAGGVVVLQRPSGTRALGLAGITGMTANTGSVTIVRVEASAKSTFGIFDKLDSAEELSIPVVDRDTFGDLKVYMDVYTGVTNGGTVLMRAYDESNRGAEVGPMAVARTVGQGRIYAFGHNMYAYYSYRAGYINTFDPAIDVWGLLLRGFLREATGGHSVVKHTVPGAQGSAMYISHDASWDEDYVKEMNDAAATVGGWPNYYVQTPIGTNTATYRNVAVYLATHGSAPLMAHTVEHESDFNTQPVGDCSLSLAQIASTYKANPRTLCGEIAVPKYWLEQATGLPVTGFRSPYLLIHSKQFQLLKQLGYTVDSSIAISELKTSLPIATEKINILQFQFNRNALYTMPLQCEDGYVDANKVRTDLQVANLGWFATKWRYITARTAHNNAHTMILDHPAIGFNSVDVDNRGKINASVLMYKFAAANNIQVQNLASLITWWKAREAANVVATFTTAGAYEGSVSTGANLPIDNFVLEFGDFIRDFTCACCGASSITNNRVVIAHLNGGVTCSFRATTGVNPAPPPATTAVPSSTSTPAAQSSAKAASSNTPAATTSVRAPVTSTPAPAATSSARPPTTSAAAPPASTGGPAVTPTTAPTIVTCPAPQGATLIENFATPSRFTSRTNILGGTWTDDGTMNLQRTAASTLQMTIASAASHWVMNFVGGNACYSLDPTVDALILALIAPRGIDFDVRVTYRTNGEADSCSGSTLSAVVSLSSIADTNSFAGTRPANAVFPLVRFGSIRRSALVSVGLENFRVAGRTGSGDVVQLKSVTVANC